MPFSLYQIPMRMRVRAARSLTPRDLPNELKSPLPQPPFVLLSRALWQPDALWQHAPRGKERVTPWSLWRWRQRERPRMSTGGGTRRLRGNLGAVEPVAGALANDLGGVHEVVEDGLVHGREGPAAGAGVGETALGRGHDPAGSDHHDVLRFVLGGGGGGGGEKGGVLC